MKPKVFIHTNNKQLIGAKLAAYSLKSRSSNPDAFDVEILQLESVLKLSGKDGKSYLRKGKNAIWKNSDLQSFSPLRMMIPQLMNYKGRALVIDPDVFAIGDVNELLTRNMDGKAILCRHIKEGYQSNGHAFYATSVMLLDCEKLKHWRWDDLIDSMFDKKLDYGDWISLRFENPELIGEIGEEWNQFDQLNQNTKLLHNTERSTQPWKTGLKVDYDTTFRKSLLARVKNRLIPERYQPHPDKNQEIHFLKLLDECLREKVIDKDFLHQEVQQSNLRKDIFAKLENL